MIQVGIEKISKAYAKDSLALQEVDLEISQGEFIAIVGPSGCGKSTLLRVIAGLETPTSGEISISGHHVTSVPPAERGVAMVFQDYALYPHMNVFENLSFGLRMRKVPKIEIQKQVMSTAEILGLGTLLERKPSQLSGGQRQRVAIGRAMIKQPQVFLLDEPLSNLDAQLRAQTRIELAALHRRIGSTTLYVTHDQEEAMTLADRIVVLNKGQVQQFDRPLTLYQKPSNRFVASFIGSPTMNFIEGELRMSGGEKLFESENIKLDLSGTSTPEKSGQYTLGIRPEAILKSDPGNLKLKLNLIEYHGHEIQVVTHLGPRQIILRSSDQKTFSEFEKLRPGEAFSASLQRTSIHWFEPSSKGSRIA